MRKSILILVLSAVVLLSMAGGFFLYYYSEGESTNKNIDVFMCNPEEVESYSVAMRSGGYDLVKKDGIWYVENKEVSNLNSKSVESMIRAASALKATGTLSRKHLGNFDKKDTRTLKLVLSDGKTLEIKFLGSLNNETAFRVLGDRTTYRTHSSVLDILAPQLDKLRILEIYETLSSVDSLPTYYSYTGYDGESIEVRVKNGNELAKSDRNSYMMVSPYCHEVDDASFEQQIAMKLPVMKATTFATESVYNPDIYGLDEESRATLSFIWDDVEETLYLGKNEGGLTYAKKKGEDTVFQISTTSLEFLTMDPFYLLDRKMAYSDASKIKRLKVETGNELYELKREGQVGSDNRYYINGNVMSEAVYEQVTEALSGIEFLGDLTKVPENKNGIKIEIQYENLARPQIIRLVGLEHGTYAAFIDGKAEFSVSVDGVEALLNEIRSALKRPMQSAEKG